MSSYSLFTGSNAYPRVTLPTEPASLSPETTEAFYIYEGVIGNKPGFKRGQKGTLVIFPLMRYTLPATYKGLGMPSTDFRTCARCKKDLPSSDFIFEGRLRRGLCRFCLQTDAESPRTKRCTKCKENLPISHFSLYKEGHRASWCNGCMRAYQKEKRNLPNLKLDIKICRVCKIERPISDFYKCYQTKDGYASLCKSCQKVEIQKRNKFTAFQVGSLIITWGMLKQRVSIFKLTYEQVRRYFEETKGVCPICQNEFKNPRDMVIDHSHITNEIRGILCFHCNLVLGHAKESPQTLRAAANYLEKKVSPLLG